MPLVRKKPLCSKPVSALIVSLKYTVFILFQRWLWVTPHAYLHNSASQHRHIHTILHHTTGIFTPFSITPQAYSHHSASQHRYINTNLHHTTGIFTPSSVTPKAYSHHSASHHRHIHIILHHTTGIFTPFCITPQAYATTHTHKHTHAHEHAHTHIYIYTHTHTCTQKRHLHAHTRAHCERLKTIYFRLITCANRKDDVKQVKIHKKFKRNGKYNICKLQYAE